MEHESNNVTVTYKPCKFIIWNRLYFPTESINVVLSTLIKFIDQIIVGKLEQKCKIWRDWHSCCVKFKFQFESSKFDYLYRTFHPKFFEFGFEMKLVLPQIICWILSQYQLIEFPRYCCDVISVTKDLPNDINLKTLFSYEFKN